DYYCVTWHNNGWVF
nr:immunoglobulin light chain junction region [Macaca mulatta]